MTARGVEFRMLVLPAPNRAGADGDGSGPRPLPPGGPPAPASANQRWLWQTEQEDPGGAADVVPAAARIRGPLDPDLLRQAVTIVCHRHDVVRTRLARQDGRLVQVVAPVADPPWSVVDLPTTAGAGLPPAAAEILAARSAQPFDLAEGPLLRAVLLRLAHRDHILALLAHHAVTDDWSNAILLSEVAVSYAELVVGRPPDLPGIALRYADVAAWQRDRLAGRHLDKLLGYWRDQLAGAPHPLPLPTDRPRRPGARRAAGYAFELPPELVRPVREFARAARTSTLALVVAGLAGTLGAAAGRDDVLIGAAHSGRTHPSLDHVPGPLDNTLVLRLRPEAGLTGRALVQQAARVVFGAHAHAELPFGRLVEQVCPAADPAYPPLVQVAVSVNPVPPHELLVPLATVAALPVPAAGAARFDLSLRLDDIRDGWRGTVVYNADLFDRGTVDHWMQRLWDFLGAVAAGPDRPLKDLLRP